VTARLREVLHQAAQDVPAYPVYDRAVATARRSRRRTVVATTAAVLTALVLALLPTSLPRIVDTAADGPVALPSRIGGPVLGALHVTDWPRLGSAAVVFSGGRCVLGDECDTMGVVGATADRYRTFDVERDAPAGGQTLLSPDGRQVAYPVGYEQNPHVAITDLGTGRTRDAPGAVPGSLAVTPVGWSRDGTRLVVRDTVPADPAANRLDDVLSIVDLSTRQAVRLGSGSTIDGFTVAFAPDGHRLAYQIGTNVTVADLAGHSSGFFVLHDAEAALAGKGAWTPDGAALTIVERSGGSWRLRYVDPATGREVDRKATPTVPGVTTIRLLGWDLQGSAVVVGYQPEPRSPAQFDQTMTVDQRIQYGNVRTVQVLALSPGGTAPRVLLAATETAKAIDVADNVIAGGRVRDAHPPRFVGPRFWLWATPVCLLAVALALWWRYRRVTRRRG
jgi:hypothetical protein